MNNGYYKSDDVDKLIKKIKEYDFARDCLDICLLLVIIFIVIGWF